MKDTKVVNGRVNVDAPILHVRLVIMENLRRALNVKCVLALCNPLKISKQLFNIYSITFTI